MSYLGNASLAPEVQERISRSFQQTVDLVKKGNDREAKLGCEFILGMDPLFRPATTLLQRIEEGQRPISIEDLLSDSLDGSAGDSFLGALDDLDASPMIPPDPASGTGAAADGGLDLDGLDDLDDLGDLGDLDDLDGLDDLSDLKDFGGEPGSAEQTPAAPAVGLGAVLQDLLARRNFEQVLQIAQSQQAAISADPELQAMVERAQTLQESGQFVENFLDSARAVRDAGQVDEARKLLDKARTLDPEHPSIAAFERESELPDAAAVDAQAPTEVVDGLGDLDHLPELDDLDDLGGFEPLDGAGDLDSIGDLDTELTGDDEESPMPVAAEETAEIVTMPAEELAPEPPPAATAAAEESADSGTRIAQLLAEGQDAFDRDDYQGALDVWSRIFLIDIDNAEASQRIEQARNRKAELERKAEEIFNEGLTHLETSDLDAAREAFGKVLELQPSHSVAREYLDQLEAGEVPTLAPGGDTLGSLTAEEREARSLEEDEDEHGPSLEAAVQRDRIVVVRRTDRRLIALGALVLVLVVAGGGFLVTRWDTLFPNADEAAVPSQAPNVVDRATFLHEQGNTAAAIRMLEKITSVDPFYDQAQPLLAQWRALIEAPPDPEPVETGPSETELRQYRLLVQAAREAADRGENLTARRYLTRAEQIVAFDGADRALADRVDQALSPLVEEIERYRNGEWEEILPSLWRRLDANPGDADVRLLIIDSYYNLGLRALQRRDPKLGASMLKEAVALDPDNEGLERVLLFAQTYSERPVDLLYRIYVKYLPSRP